LRRHARVLFAVAALVSFFTFAASASAIYESRGTFSGPGAGNGQLDGPGHAAAEQSTGNLFAVDSGNDRVQVFAPNGSGTADYLTQFGGGELSAPWGIAIDEQGGQTYVYVADAGNDRIVKYASDEASTPSFTIDGSFSVPKGSGAGQVGDFHSALAVDPTTHDLLVADLGNDEVKRFEEDGTAVAAGSFDGSEGAGSPGAFTHLLDLAVNSAGDIYVIDATGPNIAEQVDTSKALRYGAAGSYKATLSPVGQNDAAASVAVNTVTDEVVVYGDQDGIYLAHSPFPYFFDAANQALPSPRPDVGYQNVADIAFSSSFRARLYVVLDFAHGWGSLFGEPRILALQQPAVKEVNTQAASGSTPTGATLNGAINPDGIALTECKFEYGSTAAYGNVVPCAEAPGSIGSGTAPVPVHADVSGLAVGIYHFRLVASNASGTTNGGDETVAVPGPPVIVSQSANPESNRAVLKAHVNPGNQATTYRFEYGPTAAYGSSTPAEVIAAGNSPVGVFAVVGELEPGSEYHFRVVASNGVGVAQGVDNTFTTDPREACPNAPIRAEQGSTQLRACRAYEQVSPTNKLGQNLFNYNGSGEEGGWIYNVAVADDGSAASFQSTGPFANPKSGNTLNDYVAYRGSAGWQTHSVSHKSYPGGTSGSGGGANTMVGGWSADLRKALVLTNDEGLSPGTEPFAPGAVPGRNNIYLTEVKAGVNAAVTVNGSELSETYPNPELAYVGASRDLSTVAFEDSTQHLPNTPPLSWINPYAWHDGEVELVSILPDPDGPGSQTGEPAPEGAMIGGGPGRQENAVSDDGSRIYFSTFDGRIYVRENGSSTVEVSASRKSTPDPHQPASFQIASADGRYAFFLTTEQLLDSDTDGVQDLYRYDLETDTLIRLSQGAQNPNYGGVLYVLGVSADGSYAYFGSIFAGYDGVIRPEVEAQELYVWHAGELRYVGVGEFSMGIGARASTRVSADGTGAVFLSQNKQSRAGDFDPQFANQVYLYDAVADSLSCASCRYDGNTPGRAFLPRGSSASSTGSQIPGVVQSSITADGDTVFFSSPDPLVPADSNQVQDAYEFSQGRPHLLSTGLSPYPSLFVNASPDGKDAYFVTTERLTRSDGDGNVDLYDARAGGGYLEPPPAVLCSGEACKGPVSTAPPPSSAGSAQFSGPGNAKDRAKGKKKPKKKKKKQAKKRQQKKRGHKSSRAAGSERGVGK
jgi:hypothetical protein